jgi:hypothetical protein
LSAVWVSAWPLARAVVWQAPSMGARPIRARRVRVPNHNARWVQWLQGATMATCYTAAFSSPIAKYLYESLPDIYCTLVANWRRPLRYRLGTRSGDL